jgi:hypothetical protein
MEKSTSLSGGRFMISAGNTSKNSLTTGISPGLRLGSGSMVNMTLKHLLLEHKYWIIWCVFCSRAVRALLSAEVSVEMYKFFSAHRIYTVLAESQSMPSTTSNSFIGRQIRSMK